MTFVTSELRLIRYQTACDYLRKLVHGLIQQYDLIAVEDLRKINMVRNKHLSKSILDSGWEYYIQPLMFKAEEAGHEVVLVDARIHRKHAQIVEQRLIS